MSRNPQKTRERLLQSAYEEIHAHGFQGMRVDKVLLNSGLKKGAFYHHFRSKTDLGYAVLEEQIRPLIETVWLTPLREMQNPVIEFPEFFDNFGETIPATMIQHGCPLNNLAQEMATQDDGFRERITTAFDEWIKVVEQLFDKAKAQGIIRKDINTAEVGSFIVASLEGCISLTKIDSSKDHWKNCTSQLQHYIKSLQ